MVALPKDLERPIGLTAWMGMFKPNESRWRTSVILKEIDTLRYFRRLILSKFNTVTPVGPGDTDHLSLTIERCVTHYVKLL